MRRLTLMLLVVACASPQLVAARSTGSAIGLAPSDPAQQVATAFVTATRAGRFDDALSLTTARWRERVTGAQFQADFENEPMAGERLARLELALANGAVVTGKRAELILAGTTVMVLLQVDGAWQVDALTR